MSAGTKSSGSNDQGEVIAFLSQSDTHPGIAAAIERRDTHGAIVFLAGDTAYKIKRAVKYDYLDFSTLEQRRQMVIREFEINRQFAPELYLGIIAITRDASGALTLGGCGLPVEWAVKMRRFDEAHLLSAMAQRGALTRDIAIKLADVIQDAHRRMRPVQTPEGAARVEAIIDAVSRQLKPFTALLGPSRLDEFHSLVREQWRRAAACLDRRATSGFVRRCHGDLHLNNVVLLSGRPTLFDALEFDDKLATIDTLYDLAFLLMDIEHAGQRAHSNIVLNRYLWRSQDLQDVQGLAAMPLFLGLRSSIRAMTNAQRADLLETCVGSAATKDADAARIYLADAIRYLSPPSPRLIAVGGVSGTGKTTLATELAHRIGPSPGALHIRTDLERKAMLNVEETDRLPVVSYTLQSSRAVYRHVLERAGAALAAGHSVVVDAVFLAPEERAGIGSVATRLGVPFNGIWLTAPREVLLERVASRVGDASDATPDVVERQIKRSACDIRWTLVDAGGGQEATLRHAIASLGLEP